MNYDAVILSHPKDYNKLRFCLDSLNNLDPYPQNIYVISPDRHHIDGVNSILDHEAIGIFVDQIKYKRPFWILQQLIKLYQGFTLNDVYMVIDSDVIFNRPIIFSGKTFFISDRPQYHQPYFNFIKDYFDVERKVDQTFISDFMILDRNICKKFVPPLGKFVEDLNEWLKDEKYLLSEYELYGNWVYNNMPAEYTIRQTKQKTLGQFAMWDTEQLKIIVETAKTLPIDLFTVHTWT